MAKALKEAKVNTSWIQPNEQWDAAMNEFVAKVLDPSPKNKFIPSFLPLAEEIARLGAINSLAQVVLKLTAPGVPDIYQGNEIWDFSLVDPDNRRPVDYAHRRKLLDSLDGVTPEELLQNWADGRIKLFVTQRLLRFRRDHPALFQQGNICRWRSRERLLSAASALSANMKASGSRSSSRGFPRASVSRRSARNGKIRWQLCRIRFRAGVRGNCSPARDLPTDTGSLRLSKAMATLPFAVYTNQGAAV